MPEIDDKVYDVAISFLGADETYAKELHDALRERLEVFYYAGSGIKQRAASEGYSFSIWVPVGQTKSVPAFIDPQFIWYDIDRWGIQGLAAIVEKHVQESGRDVRPETTGDRLLKVKRRIDLEKQRRAYEESQDGVKFVSDCYSRLENVIKTQLECYTAVSTDVQFHLTREHELLIVISFSYRCAFYLDRYAQNTIKGASLAAYINENVGTRNRKEDWLPVSEFVFKPTLDDNGDPGWLLEGQGFFTLETAVAHALDNMAERVYLAYEKYVAEVHR